MMVSDWASVGRVIWMEAKRPAWRCSAACADEQQVSTAGHHVTGRIVRVSAFWLVLAALYALLAGQISLTEAAAGLIATGLAAGYGVLLHRSGSRVLALSAPWPRMVLRPLAALVPDAWRVGRVLLTVLWRRPEGSVGTRSRQTFRRGGHGGEDAGRRGIVTLALSLAPNGYVLGIGPSDISLHRLAPATPSGDREWPA
jgi:hypothetical protein